MKKRRATAQPRIGAPLPVRLAWPLAAIFSVVIPLWVSIAGREAFRTPKLALFHAEGIVLLALILLAALVDPSGSLERWRTARRELALVAVILVWSLVAVAVSPERAVSLTSFVTVLCGVSLFMVAFDRGRTAEPGLLLPIVVPALVNVCAVFYEADPARDLRFARTVLGEFSEESLLRSTPIAFMGNRDDLAVMLIPAAILAVAVAAGSEKRRGLLLVIAAVIIGGVLATKTLTAIAAMAAALVVFAFLRSWRAGAVTMLAAAIVVAALFTWHPALRARADALRENVRAGRFESVVVGRVAPAIAAWIMARDHPATGVGLGQFGSHYHQYRIAAAREHPSLVATSGWIDYFEHAHNDHLQVLAETGFVGYGILAVAIAAGLRLSFGAGEPRSRKQRIAAMAAAPLFVAFAVVALAQFPMRLAGTLQSYIACAGLIVGWSRNASD